MPFNPLRYLMPERVTHQRNAPTKDANGGDVANWSTVATGLRCAIWPVQEVPELAQAFARRDILVSHIMAFAADIGAKSSDRIVKGTDYYVVESVENYSNSRVMSQPVYCVGANLRTV
jgi:hypothetical protein